MTAASDEPMSILYQLQQYQKVIREWDRYLDVYEFKVVMQILDRTVGWKKEAAVFRNAVIQNGDRKYSGLGRSMHRSKLLKTLRSLEERGILRRVASEMYPGLKQYSLDLDWEPTFKPVSEQIKDRVRPVSMGDGVVSNQQNNVADGDLAVSSGDPRETYREKDNLTGNQENSDPANPEATPPALRSSFLSAGRGHFINPPPRRRPSRS